WERVAQSRRSFGFLFTLYLLPMVLTLAVLEGFSLMEWGRRQRDSGGVKIFHANEMVIYEIAQSLLTLAMVFICAQIVKSLCNTSYLRHNFTQGFTVAACGLSPLFLLRLLDVFPAVNPWLTWGVGILLCVTTLYHGLPRVIQPDPSQAFGLFLMCSVLFIMVTGLERFVTVWYLAGRIPGADNILSHITQHMPF
ncbi:MAG TPA: YIP1 family protein, partial [Candidatus Paceibacterota bacterium]|nr:YIP1 family protein [Candidatus Paceibacterota bacterium]